MDCAEPGRLHYADLAENIAMKQPGLYNEAAIPASLPPPAR